MTSINAEPEFWEQFRLIVMERGTTISELLAELTVSIDYCHTQMHILEYWR
jgi:hypothetical protein